MTDQTGLPRPAVGTDLALSEVIELIRLDSHQLQKLKKYLVTDLALLEVLELCGLDSLLKQ
jgi:hypothetical protein